MALEIGIKSVAFYSNCECNALSANTSTLEHIYKLSKALQVPITEFFKDCECGKNIDDEFDA